MVAIPSQLLPALEPITLDRVKAIQTLPSGQTRRKCFEGHSGIQAAKKNSSISFSVNFKESIKPVYEAMTGFELKFSSTFKNYWHSVKKEDVEKIQKWEHEQGCRVFIRDNLSISIALGMYSTDPNDEKHTTEIGKLVYRAKYKNDAEAVKELAARCAVTIKSLPYYRKASHICAVPPAPAKERDLPSEIAGLVAKELKIENITGNFKYHGKKAALKGLGLNEKWPALEGAKLVYEGSSLKGKKIILIDDLYQSGVTMQFVAMKLQEAGAHHVYGLSMTKNLSDTDNK